jgi:hypothetical protein
MLQKFKTTQVNCRKGNILLSIYCIYSAWISPLRKGKSVPLIPEFSIIFERSVFPCHSTLYSLLLKLDAGFYSELRSTEPSVQG